MLAAAAEVGARVDEQVDEAVEARPRRRAARRGRRGPPSRGRSRAPRSRSRRSSRRRARAAPGAARRRPPAATWRRGDRPRSFVTRLQNWRTRPTAPCDAAGHRCGYDSSHVPGASRAEPGGRAPALPRVPARRRAALEHRPRRSDRPGAVRGPVPADRLRDHARLPPAADPPLLPDAPLGRVRAGDPRLDGRPGPGHVLGRRPSQAPCAHRPARAIRTRRTGTAAGCAARSPGSGTRTWAGSSTAPGRPSTAATRASSTRTAGCG